MSILLKLIHELNQPLTVIKAYLGGCLIRLKKNELSQEQIISVLEKINENAELFENKVYSMQQVIIQEEYRDIPTILTEITSLFAFEAQHYGIRFILDFDEVNSSVPVDKSLVMQMAFRLLKLCVAIVEANKIQNAELRVQAQLDKKNALSITIKSNFPIKDSVAETELNYCRSLFVDENGTLTMKALPDGICFTISIFDHGRLKYYQGVG